jgi:PAP2 superfamily
MLANWVYIWGHWPVILGTATVLFVYRRDRYYVLRNALFVSGAIGFLFFAFFPGRPAEARRDGASRRRCS